MRPEGGVGSESVCDPRPSPPTVSNQEYEERASLVETRTEPGRVGTTFLSLTVVKTQG